MAIIFSIIFIKIHSWSNLMYLLPVDLIFNKCSHLPFELIMVGNLELNTYYFVDLVRIEPSYFLWSNITLNKVFFIP
jgi:hypothetical protein